MGPVLPLALLVLVGAALGALVFWSLKRLFRLPVRTRLIAHVAIRLLSALVSSVGVVVAFFTAFPPSGRGDVPDFVAFFFVTVSAGIPALVFGAGLGQRSRPTDELTTEN